MADWGRGQNAVAMEDMLDVENKRMTDNLASKVTRLKSDSDFLSATGLLTGSMKRFSTMTRSGRENRKLLCFVSVGLVVVFFILYYLVSKAGT
uniref:Bet1 golgi vesicular membrane trafficking protein like n=1 Tax=Coturnix japonica TaxID=93934 RepID=A0A8C2YCM0_COTJA